LTHCGAASKAVRAEDRALYSSRMTESDRGERIFCHACDAPIDGEAGGHGLLVFVRGDRVEYEEPELCSDCALAIGVTALWRFAEQEEEG